MVKRLTLLVSAISAVIVAGCTTPLPPGAEPGPHGTMAYEILIEASEPGADIIANGQSVGRTPVKIKVFGDPDGTFHDFGSYYYEIRATPLATNQYAQVQTFQTGHMMTEQDTIPNRVFFDMNRPPPVYVPTPVYVAPPPSYYGPSFYFDYGWGYPHYYHGYRGYGGYHGYHRGPSHPIPAPHHVPGPHGGGKHH